MRSTHPALRQVQGVHCGPRAVMSLVKPGEVNTKSTSFGFFKVNERQKLQFHVALKMPRTHTKSVGRSSWRSSKTATLGVAGTNVDHRGFLETWRSCGSVCYNKMREGIGQWWLGNQPGGPLGQSEANLRSFGVDPSQLIIRLCSTCERLCPCFKDWIYHVLQIL